MGYKKVHVWFWEFTRENLEIMWLLWQRLTLLLHWHTHTCGACSLSRPHSDSSSLSAVIGIDCRLICEYVEEGQPVSQGEGAGEAAHHSSGQFSTQGSPAQDQGQHAKHHHPAGTQSTEIQHNNQIVCRTVTQIKRSINSRPVLEGSYIHTFVKVAKIWKPSQH